MRGTGLFEAVVSWLVAMKRTRRRIGFPFVAALASLVVGSLGIVPAVAVAATPGYAVSDYAVGFPNGGGIGPTGLAFDGSASSANLFVMDYATGVLYKFPAGGGGVSPATSTPHRYRARPTVLPSVWTSPICTRLAKAPATWWRSARRPGLFSVSWRRVCRVPPVSQRTP
jgi:hypothetical protein